MAKKKKKMSRLITIPVTLAAIAALSYAFGRGPLKYKKIKSKLKSFIKNTMAKKIPKGKRLPYDIPIKKITGPVEKNKYNKIEKFIFNRLVKKPRYKVL